MHFDPSLNNTCPETLQIVGIGDIEVPISLQNAEKLLTVAKHSFFGHGFYQCVNKSMISSWFIERADGISIPKSSTLFQHSLHSWMEMVMNKHGIDLRAIKAGCNLTRMCIYPSGSHYVRQRHVAKESGHFGTLILQIPVEGGHEGGSLMIEDYRKSEILNLSSNSDRLFYLTFLNVDCEHEMEPIRCGYRVELIFNLLWEAPNFPVLPNVLTFLVTLTKLTAQFRNWEEKIAQGDPSKLMIIDLEYNYNPECHSFSTLMDADKYVAHLVCSIYSLDVHLARLIRRETKSKVDKSVSPSSLSTSENSSNEFIVHITHSASHWIDVNNCATQFHDLDIDRQAQFSPRNFDELTETDIIENSDLSTSRFFYRTVLIVWPKKHSFYFNLHHRFDYLLNQMEWGRVQNSLTVLRQIISHPVWTKTALRICRLLNICTSLNAKEEALQLLHLMADESIGVPSKEAAALISDLECNLIGWPDCEDVVKKLLICRPEQLPHLAALAQELSYRNCIKGFYTVSNETWNLFLEYFQTPTNIPDRSTLIAIIKLLILMEEHRKFPDHLRLDQFVNCFVKCSLLTQCQLIIDIKDICRKSFVGQHLYFKLCHYVAVTIHPNNLWLADYVVDLFHCCLQLGQDQFDIARTFVNNICQQFGTSGETNYLLEKLVASLDMFTDLPSFIVAQLLDARIQELNSFRPPEFTWEQKEARFPDADKYPEVLAFLQSSEESKKVALDFTKIQDARDFISKNFENMEECLKRGYSATAMAYGKGKHARCLITKTRDLYMAVNEEFKTKTQELCRLCQLRNGLR